MFIYQGKRVWPHVKIIEVNGINYSVDNQSDREAIGIEEIPEPAFPEGGSDRTHYKSEQDAAPFVIYTKKPVDQVLPQLWSQVKQIRDSKTQTSGYLAAGKWFHSDTFSRTQQMGLVMMGAGIPAGLQWKTMEGSFVTMTQTLAMQVFAAAAAQDQATFAAAEAHRATLAAMADVADMVAHDIQAGWPTGYVAP